MRLNLRGFCFVLAATLAACLICLPASAQLNTGRISGQITDQTGGAISGAKVTVIDVARGQNRELVADAAGQYAAPNLLPGVYTVRAEFMGFQTVNRENVEVTAGGDVRVDITMQPGATTQTVTVTETLPIINTTNSQTGGTLDNQQLSNLPMNGRNYRWEYNLSVPGVMVGIGEGSSDQIVNGSPVTNGMWNFMFDGLYSETFFTLEVNAGGTGEGGDTTLMPLDAIQEVNIVINPKAEYGWAPGITQNIALKSGTNTIHGSAFAFGRDTAFDAKNPFASTTTPIQFEQFGATMGGPIKKDKLFYFGAYEGERLSTVSNYTTLVPTEESLAGISNAGCTQALAAGTGNCTNSIPDAIADINRYLATGTGAASGVALSQLSAQLSGCNFNSTAIHSTTPATVATACGPGSGGPLDLWNNYQSNTSQTPFAMPEAGGSNNGLIKLDYHLSDHHALNGSLYIGRYAENVVPNGDGIFTQAYYEELTTVASDMGRLVEIWTPNSSWLNEARVGIDHANRPVYREECLSPGASSSGIGASTGNDGGPNYQAVYGLVTGAPGCGIPTIKINKFTGQLGFANNRVDWENPIQGADSVSYTRGSHQFKFGTDIRAENFDGAKVLDASSGIVNFGSTGFAAFASATPLEDFLSGEAATETIRPTTNVRHLTSDKIAFFAQDDWRVIPRLTLNLGVRWEAETPIMDANGQLGNFAPGTVTGVIQKNQVFPFQDFWEPRGGLAWDVTGKGTTTIRAGGGIMYMIPMGMNYVGGGDSSTTDDWGAVPTGSTLVYANGTKINTPGNQVGNITSALITPTAITNSSGVIVLPSNLPWAVNSAVFPASTVVPQCGDGQPIGGIGTAVSASNPLNPAPCYGQGGNSNLKLFPFASWNLNIQHAFTNKLSLDVGYVGSRAWNLIDVVNLNQPYAGISGSANATVNGITYPGEFLREPYNIVNGTEVGQQCTAANTNCYPWFSNINYQVNSGGSTYAGLEINLTAKNIHGVTFSANYTLSHSLVQSEIWGLPNPLQYGNNTLDVRDHYAMTFSYAIPAKKVPGQMLEGWALNGSVNMLSHLPMAITDTSDDLMGWGSSVGDYWDLYGAATPFNRYLGGAGQLPCFAVAGSKFASDGCTVVPDGSGTIGTPSYVANLPAPCVAGAEQYSTSNGGNWNVANNTSVPVSTKYGYNGLAQLALLGCYVEGGSALTPPAQGTFGNLYPSELRGKGAGILNASITKDWKIKERLTTQFRFEVFNVLNRTQYSQYTIPANLGSPTTVGVATSTPDVAHGNAVVGSGGPREMQLGLKFLW